MKLNHFVELGAEQLRQLEGALVNILQRLEVIEGNERATAEILEKLMTGIQAASEQYADDAAFGEFSAAHADRFKGYQEALGGLPAGLGPGAGYDLARNFYDNTRGMEDAAMEEYISGKLEAIRGMLGEINRLTEDLAGSVQEVEQVAAAVIADEGADAPVAPAGGAGITLNEGEEMTPDLEALIAEMG